MRLIEFLANNRPSDGIWLVVSLVALGLIVAAPSAVWAALDAAVYGGGW